MEHTPEYMQYVIKPDENLTEDQRQARQKKLQDLLQSQRDFIIGYYEGRHGKASPKVVSEVYDMTDALLDAVYVKIKEFM